MAMPPGLEQPLKKQEADMAVQLRSNSNTQIFSMGLAARLDRGIPQCLRPRSDRPALVMHWVEEPGGRIICRWDVERP
jgi:hypothetical protein